MSSIPEVGNPFNGEGNHFWGNWPPFSPSAHPAGTFYQRSNGLSGHAIGAQDATPEIRAQLDQRLVEMAHDKNVIVNKNPYNSVRIGWLKALYPQSTIIAVYRKPIPNIYSLSKKFVEHAGRGRGPEDEWWGVKPAGWLDMRCDDVHMQLSSQWNSINQAILGDLHQVSYLIRYDDFCERPKRYLERILSDTDIAFSNLGMLPSRLTCLDQEYRSGARLLSRNRDYVASGNFEITEDRGAEFPPLSDRQKELIRKETSVVHARLDGNRLQVNEEICT